MLVKCWVEMAPSVSSGGVAWGGCSGSQNTMPEHGNSSSSALSPVAQPGLCQYHFTSSPLVPAPYWAARQGVPHAVATLEMLHEMVLFQLLSAPARSPRGIWH